MGESYDHGSEEDFSTKTAENVGASSLSGDEEAYIPSPRRSGRGARKRVVKVPFSGGGDGYRSKGEVPPDSWSWRKYGQKPIKGSPYPRGYYRCSSSKGCPARKQVERSRLDPTSTLITYSSEHNHSLAPNIIDKKPHRQNSPPPKVEPEDPSAAAASPSSSTQPDFELAGELGWLCEDVGSTMMDWATLVGPICGGHAEMELFVRPIGAEDELLFGGLGDLPEYSLVFRRVETPSDNFL